jgi:hypothetical protein
MQITSIDMVLIRCYCPRAGLLVGASFGIVGLDVGAFVGSGVGSLVGASVGAIALDVGTFFGPGDGSFVGTGVDVGYGADVCVRVGFAVGASVA